MRPALLGPAILAVAAAFPASGPARAAEEPGPRKVADFEDPNTDVGWRASSYERIADPDGGHGFVARWTIEDSDKSPMIFLRGAPSDLTPWRYLHFRMRQVSGDPQVVFLRVVCGAADELRVRIPGVGRAWRPFEVDLASLSEKGAPDPRAIQSLAFGTVAHRPSVYLLDDVVLDTAPAPADPGTEERRKARTWTVGPPGAPGWEETTDAKASGLAVAEEKGRKVLAWRIEAGAAPAAAYLFDVPRDFLDYRALRFRVRASGPTGAPVAVLFMAGYEDSLLWRLPAVTTAWAEVEVPLGLLVEDGDFDPVRFECLSFQVEKGAACTVFLDGLRFERGEGTPDAAAERQRLEYAFGKGGAGKGTHLAVGMFDVYTDSRAALSSFPAALEKASAFVRENLGLPPPSDRVPVYLFQSSAGFRDFLVRARGWERKKAEAVAAVGNASYLALWYRAPDDARVVHELAHCLFHRGRGRRGGSWFQEGVGRYIELRWQDRHPAEEFSARLRSGDFLPLAKFVAIPDLFAAKDPKGGAADAESLFPQAAALYEFLRRGPLKERWAAAEPAVARLAVPEAERAAALEKILGTTLADLQAKWVEWGSHPPKE